MAEQIILIIRHAEKPEPQGDQGIDAHGSPDDHSLTPRGWQRAGAWAELFVPALGQTSTLPRPAQIFASDRDKHAGADDGSKSRRPEETVTPLADKLGLSLNLDFTKGQEAGLAQAVAAQPGVTLVCWQHEDILAIVQQFVQAGLPAAWPGTVFNVVFRLQRADDQSPWSFDQRVPVMLHGDGSDPI